MTKEEILINIEKEGGPYLTTDVVDRADALQAMDCYYNKAIDDAVKLVNGYWDWKVKDVTALRQKLEALKKLCPIP
jgi:hypothetical protein